MDTESFTKSLRKSFFRAEQQSLRKQKSVLNEHKNYFDVSSSNALRDFI